MLFMVLSTDSIARQVELNQFIKLSMIFFTAFSSQAVDK